MIIGIPKEIMHGENRVSATPETVAKFVADGFKVLFEKGAGEGAQYHDEEYAQAGATLVDGAKAVYDGAEVILKVKEPLFNEQLNTHEVELMRKGQYLITFIHPASPVNHEMVRNLAKQGVISYLTCTKPRRTDFDEYLCRLQRYPDGCRRLRQLHPDDGYGCRYDSARQSNGDRCGCGWLAGFGYG